MALVELDRVEKRYGELRALKEVSLTLEPGRIGLLGPNGAGKSTLLKTMLGLIPFDSGSVKVFDLDVARQPFEVRSLIGFMPEGDSVMPELTALEYATFAAELCGLPLSEATGRAHQVLHYVGLGEARYRKLGGFSTGMRQRARLAQALVRGPEAAAARRADERTRSARARRDARADLDIPARTGASVILSTHILPDVEKTCDQVVVVAQGEVLYAGALAPLVATEAGLYEVRVKGDPDRLRQPLELAKCLVKKNGSTLEVRVPAGATADLVLGIAVESGIQIRHLAPFVQTLERAFFATLEKAGATAPEA